MDVPDTSLGSEPLLRHASFLRSLTHGLLSDPSRAEDVHQETWLRFLRRPPRGRSAERSWLRAVASRLSVESLRGEARRRAREERAARPEALPSAADEVAQAEVARTVVGVVLALDEPYRTSVLLFHWRGWDARRIARETGTPLATVRSRLQRAHGKLRERLDRDLGRESWAAILMNLPAARGPWGPLSPKRVGTWLAGAAVVGLGLVLYRANVSAPGRAASVVPEPLPGLVGELPPQQATKLGSERVALPPQASASSVRIAGTVVERVCAELGLPERPAAGLPLRLQLAPSALGPALVAGETRTDAAGRFELELTKPEDAPARLHVHVWTPADEDYRPLWHHEELGDPSPELHLARVPHGVLHGSVLTLDDTPVPGLALEVGGVEATSDEAGAFAIPRAIRSDPLRIRSSALTLTASEGGTPRAEGGFEPLTVRVGPAARLRVRVMDRSGRPIAGVRVAVGLPEGELAVLGLRDPGSVSGTSDAAGAVLLDGLWAGRRLRLSLTTDNESLVVDAHDGGRLLLDGGAATGRPIVVALGTTLELEARIEVERELGGVVRRPDGAPASGARVAVTDAGRFDAFAPPVLLAVEVDSSGHFAGTLRVSRIVGPLRIEASLDDPVPAPAAPRELRGLGYAGPSMPSESPTSEGGFASVERMPDELEALRALELELAPSFALTGRVLDREGRPLATLGRGGSRIHAVRPGETDPRRGREGVALADRPGDFVVHGLEAGTWDLVVTEPLDRGYSFPSFLTRFPGFTAGTRDLELRLGERHEVRVHVRWSGAAPVRSVAMHRRLWPGPGFEAPRAERRIVVHDPTGWPLGTALGFSGVGGRQIETERTIDGFDTFEGTELRLQPFEPGFYAIGLQGAEGETGALFPQATPVLWFDEGEYEIEFEPQPAATVRGRLLGADPDEFLAVALVDARGRPVPLAPVPGFTHAATVLDVSASGTFVIPAAPCGAFRLRAGTRAELEHGEARRELALTILPGENPPLELRL